MSTPNPLLVAPPIPESIKLDSHTRRFFGHDEEWDPVDAVPIDAMFRLESGDLKDMVFFGRAVRFIYGGLYLLIQEFTGDPVVDAKSPVLVSVWRLPFAARELEKIARLAKDYFAASLIYPDAKDARDWRDLVPTLAKSETTARFARFHFDAKSEMGLQVTHDSIYIVDTWREYTLYLDISTEDAFVGKRWPGNPARAFATMKAIPFHARVRALMRNEESALAQSLRFYHLEECKRYEEVLGCQKEAIERTMQLLTLALTMEMGEGGSLRVESWTWIKWQPWSNDMIEGRDENGDEWEAFAPDVLLKWLRFLCEKTGCKFPSKVSRDWDEEDTQVLAHAWAEEFGAEVTRPSAHEFLEAGIKLREMLERG